MIQKLATNEKLPKNVVADIRRLFEMAYLKAWGTDGGSDSERSKWCRAYRSILGRYPQIRNMVHHGQDKFTWE